MKKILTIALCLMLALSFAACGGNTVTENPTDATEEASKLVLTMATNAEFPPYEFYDGEVVVGIDAEVAAVIAEKLGMELEIVDTAFDSIIPAIVAGKYDMGMAGMTVTEERLEEVNFSTSYAKGVQVVIVAADSDIKTVDDLFGDKNYTIGVQTGTTGDLYSTWDIEDEGLGTVSRYNKGADAVEALKVGKVDCVIIDNEPAKAFVADSENLVILDTAYAEEDYAIAVAKDNTELLEKINTALEELMADGTLQSIVDKYISAE
ncbi:MAG: transporter substrate-binding domain-containing protein [Clostridia bacterium]|nr:transporter substrate-binding domain-containing protein [Clostridia bacterium]